jgi:hypothetical protein
VEEDAARAEVLTLGGAPLREVFIDELRETHLGPQARRRPAPDGPTVGAQMQAAYTSVF